MFTSYYIQLFPKENSRFQVIAQFPGRPQLSEGSIVLFAREDVPLKLLSVENTPTEKFCITLNLSKINGY